MQAREQLERRVAELESQLASAQSFGGGAAGGVAFGGGALGRAAARRPACTPRAP